MGREGSSQGCIQRDHVAETSLSLVIILHDSLDVTTIRLVYFRLDSQAGSVPFLPVDDVDHLFSLFPPIQIHLQDLERPVHVRFPQPADMRRDDTVRRIPQGAVFGQGFRIRHVQRRASQSAASVASVQRVVVVVGLEGVDEVGLHDDLSAGNVGDEGVFLLAQDGELFGADEVGGLFCQGDADEEVVDVLGEEMAQGRFVQAAEPGFRDRAVRIAGPGDDEALVPFRFRRGAWRGRVCDDVHAQAPSHASDLASDAAVAEDPQSLSCFIPQTLQLLVMRTFAPFAV